MPENHFDCIVIGAGPGGYVAAIRASQLGFRTAIVEQERLGGVCLNWGCIPTKALLKSAEVFGQLKRAEEFGLSCGQIDFDFAKVIGRSRQVAARMEKGIEFLLKKNKITALFGEARIESASSIKLKDAEDREKTYGFDFLIIATGARARTLPSLPIDHQRIITSRDALGLTTRPNKLLVVGAGAIGIELAYFYHSFGTEVTVVELLPEIVPMEDKEISQILARSLKKAGMNIKTGTSVESIERNGDNLTATLKSSEKTEQWSGDYCLVAIGVQGNVENLGLEKVGIEPERSFIPVSPYGQTTVENIYAIGDITGPPLLAHVASHQGIIALEHIADLNPHPLNPKNVAACTYCQPQIGSIGLSEEAARSSGTAIKVGKFPFSASGKAVAIGETEGFVKVVIDEQLEEVLGVHIIHPEATELIAEASIIKTHEGTATSVLETIHAHPTLSEAVMEAMADALGRPIHS